jgi:Immunity protein 51
MRKMPHWRIPKNLAELLVEGDGFWEDARWNPFVLTLMTGTSINGRDVPLAWQIELDPCDESLDFANERLVERELEPDGYGWGEAIRLAMAEQHPELVDELHFDDCEEETCVVWVETEEVCKKLMETAWRLAFEN